MATWNSSTARYRDDNGRLVSSRQLQGLIDRSIQASQDSMREYAMMVKDGDISAESWHTLMKRELKHEYIRMATLGAGGREQMTARHWGSVGGSLREQHRYLDRFYEQVKEGNLTEGQIATRGVPLHNIQRLIPAAADSAETEEDKDRAVMYSSSAREAFSRSFTRSVRAAGAVYEEWHVKPGSDSCDDCLSRQAEGRKLLGYFDHPGSGSTQCLTRCNCYKLFFDSEGEAIG